ncbi:MAG: hypothetical protein M3131_07660, partial [Actinomycetota bacterium]|nr:hypothetical protein [Actinomycetota bacterium]
RRCKLLDDEIAAGLNVDVAQRLGLEPLEDELSDTAGRLPRISSALRGSAFGDLLAGALDVEGLAARLGCDADAVRTMLNELGIDQLVPAAR